jgi:hypothetical protein
MAAPLQESPIGEVLILLENFVSDQSEVYFSDFKIRQITSSNWDTVKEWFSPTFVSRQGDDYYLHRTAPIHEHPQNLAGLGSLPFESEDLMLLFRLFRSGDLRFNAQLFRDPRGNALRQYAYPLVISECPSLQKYHFEAKDVPAFQKFAEEMQQSPGWSAPWFRASRRYFLWGGSKEFNFARDDPATWDLERVLDYMIALEAALVPEKDFVSRRLRERAARILATDPPRHQEVRKRLKDFYDIRSRLAHGDRVDKSWLSVLRSMDDFEKDVRQLLMYALRNFGGDPAKRTATICTLFDITDSDRANKLEQDFRQINDKAIQMSLVNRLHVPADSSPES